MARRARTVPGERRALRLFAHPRRGVALVEAPVPPAYRRYLGGEDADWREVCAVEVVRDGWIWAPAPGQRPPPGFLWGDPARQIYGLGGPEIVFGPIEKICKDCREPFVLTAREQKHLAEERGLFIDVTSVRCRGCRRRKRERERARTAYAAALRAVEQAPSAAAHLAVAQAALDVVAAGGRAPLDKALGHCRRARRLGAAATADRLERQIAARRAR